MVRIWLLLCLLSVSVAASAQPAIVVVGDSLSSGYGLGDAPSWVDLLEARLEERAYEYVVVNASIPGDTSSGGLSRLSGLLTRHQPDIVVIELGGNDGLRGLPTDLLQANLEQMIEQSLAAGARVLLTGIQIPPNMGPVYSERFAAVYHDLAQEYGIAFAEFLMDGVALDPARMQGDRIHPNSEGQAPMLENVWVALEEIL